MKRVFVLFIYIIILLPISQAQDTPACNPDTAFINSGAIVDPAPFVNDTLGDGLPDGCLNAPYNLDIFVHPPSSFNTGVLIVPVSWFRIDSITNLPAGLSYTCSTEDCTFPADSVNCIFLSGTPNAENTEEVYALKIFITINAAGFPFQASFPDPALAPGEYNIVIHPEGDPACSTVPTLDIQATPDWITLFPNPVHSQLNVQVSGNRTPVENLRVYNQSGALVKNIPLDRWSATQQLNMDDLPAGFYVTTIQTENKIYRSKFIKN